MDKKKNKKKGDGEKKEDGPITVVLSVDMNCDACTKKVMKSVKGFKGVVDVKDDRSSNKLTVLGKVEPDKLRDMVKCKTKKTVELISPLSTKANDGGGDKNSKKKADDKKIKEDTVTTVVLEIGLYCDGCIKDTHRVISKLRGVQDVKVESVDEPKHLVTLKGTMDYEGLESYLKAKLKKKVDIIEISCNKDKADKETENGGGRDEGTGNTGDVPDGNTGNGGNEKSNQDEVPPGGYCPGYYYPQDTYVPQCVFFKMCNDGNQNAKEHEIFILLFYFILLLLFFGFCIHCQQHG